MTFGHCSRPASPAHWQPAARRSLIPLPQCEPRTRSYSPSALRAIARPEAHSCKEIASARNRLRAADRPACALSSHSMSRRSELFSIRNDCDRSRHRLVRHAGFVVQQPVEYGDGDQAFRCTPGRHRLLRTPKCLHGVEQAEFLLYPLAGVTRSSAAMRRSVRPGSATPIDPASAPRSPGRVRR
jgi:hypothetical protein